MFDNVTTRGKIVAGVFLALVFTLSILNPWVVVHG